MTTTPLPALPRLAPDRSARVLRAVAIASCAPYLALKTAWLSGSRVGIPEGSVLLERPALVAVANGVTVLMDAAVIVLALLLTQRWGMRVRAGLLAFPMWVATGLLVPIMVGFPAQLVAEAVGGGQPLATRPSEPFLDAWVFPVVYGGFIVQGLALGALFVRYARGRWARLWRGTVWELSASVSGPVLRGVALAASLALLVPAGLHIGWASGMTAGLTPAQIAEATPDFQVLEAARALYAAAAVAGTLLLVFRRGRPLPVKVPLALAWTGSGAVACWGGWLLLSALAPVSDAAKEPTALLTLTYAGEMITGTVLACCVAVFLRRRAT
ncbi:hypothetical protein [Streptomyces sp. TRM64462]|uniref:hypothetical protein n=1 Tax=Streptomyces sp. TRM64462 TaxID=2741726 RepID=UPI0015869AC2|nr:hypothetical protein [Streptomyces sp. TRM64462]